MKTKTGLIFLVAFFISTGLYAQFVQIIGPSEVCLGSCEEYYAVDDTGNIYNVNGGTWGVNGSTVSSEDVAFICFGDVGDYYIYLTDANGQIITEFYVEAFSDFQPEIIALSSAYCPADSSGGSNSCDLVCANTTITYTTEINDPTQSVIWSVSGAESFTTNGNNVTVNWGEPGNGQVSVQVSPPSSANFTIACGMLEPSTLNIDGQGFVYIDGPPTNPPGGYTYELSTGDVGSLTPGNVIPFFGLPPGTYTVTVTNNGTGQVESCSFSIEEQQLDNCDFDLEMIVEDVSSCQACDGSLSAEVFGAPGGFAYVWSNGSTAASITGLCPGFYQVTVYDFEGCITTGFAHLDCVQSSCLGQNSVCVDILANPDAAFETNPPANNGVVEICEGQTVFFENGTTGGSSFTWDFGNNTSSSEVDAEYTYLTSGTYEVMLIARNECFCSDTTNITVIVEDAISPEIDCAGTICPNTEVTYSTAADCSIFNWNISTNGTIIAGGGISDNFITVDWGSGPEGLIELSVGGCNGNYCLETMFESIPIIDDNAIIKGPEKSMQRRRSHLFYNWVYRN